MLRRGAVILLTLFFSLGVLVVSVLSAASPNRAYSGEPAKPILAVKENKDVSVSYSLPFPGKILPDNSLWVLKAVRDRIQYFLAGNLDQKGALALLFSDKRLGSAVLLFDKNKPLLAGEVLSKGEKYLEEAANFESQSRAKGEDTTPFLLKLAQASLKHREVVESLLVVAPEDMRPELIKTRDYSINVYKNTRDALLSRGIAVPNNPFETN